MMDLSQFVMDQAVTANTIAETAITIGRDEGFRLGINAAAEYLAQRTGRLDDGSDHSAPVAEWIAAIKRLRMP